MLPNFFVVGAEKAGTTSFHRYLDAHPEIYMSPSKEPRYFALDGTVPPPPEPHWPKRTIWIADAQEYEALFAAVDGEKAVGEASTMYLHSGLAARRIREEIPDPRIMMILRDPSERARSAHAMYTNNGMELITDFDAAIDTELAGGTWRSYVAHGRYAASVARYLELFGADRVKVHLYEDFRDRPGDVLRETFRFLGVDTSFEPDTSETFNVGEEPRLDVVERFAKSRSRTKMAVKRVVPAALRTQLKQRALEWNRTPTAPASATQRRRLVELLRDDIAELEALIGRDLSAWRTA